MTESGAQAAGLDVIVAVKQLSATFHGCLYASGAGMIKLSVERKSGILIAATAVGPQGGEMLGLLSLAVHARVPLAELQSMIYAFLTFYGGSARPWGFMDAGWQPCSILRTGDSRHSTRSPCPGERDPGPTSTMQEI